MKLGSAGGITYEKNGKITSLVPTARQNEDNDIMAIKFDQLTLILNEGE